MKTTVQFEIVGEERIHCSGCESRIGYALRRLPGVREVEASAAMQRVSVTLEAGEASPEAVRARLGELGYEVR